MPTYTCAANSLTFFSVLSNTSVANVQAGIDDGGHTTGDSIFSEYGPTGKSDTYYYSSQMHEKFDTSAISAGETVTSVTLNQNCQNNGSSPAIQYHGLSPSTTVAWKTPSQFINLLFTLNASTSSSIVSTTGTSAANAWVNKGGTSYLVAADASFLSGSFQFTNNSSRPFGISVYRASGNSLTVVTTGGGTTQTATATGVTNSPVVAAAGTRTAVASSTAVSNSPTVAAVAAAIQSASASTTTSPTSAASATVVRAVNAAVTTSPTSTASSSATRSATAAVTTSPTSDATATQSTAAKNADAALTTSPTTAATGVRVVTATATNVTVSPTTSAAAVRVVLADSSTTVTPNTSGQIAATHNAVAAYALTPLTAAVATVTRTVSASGVTVTIITAAVADIGARRGQMSAATKATATMSATTRTSATMTGA